VILIIGCSLGAGPAQCNPVLPLDAFSGLGGGSGSGSGPAVPPPPAHPTPTPPAPPAPPPPTPPPTSTPPAAPPIATTPRRDEPTGRETLGSKQPPAGPRTVVPDEVVMTAVRALQPTFVACWKRAQRNDPSLASARIRLSLEIDASGTVTASRTDAEDEKLSRCLASVARKLAFPQLGRPASLEIPLYF
jgi:hypothetical protein